MKKLVYFLCILFIFFPYYSPGNFKIVQEKVSDPREKILELSKKKWAWSMDRQMDSLQVLFDEQIVSREPEIRMGKLYIDFKKASIIERGVRL